MKACIFSFAFCFLIQAGLAQEGEALNNKTIVDLTVAGMSKKVILGKIEQSFCKFTLDSKSLISLKKSGVESDVIDAMMEKMSTATRQPDKVVKGAVPGVRDANAAPAAGSASSAQAVTTLKQEGSGIYYYQVRESKINELEATVFSQAKNNSWATAFTHGFAKSSKVMSVSGSEANVQFSGATPIFYFYFDSENRSLNTQAPTWFANVSSPNEFLLIRFENKKVKNSRAVMTASANAYEQAQGIDDRFKTSFKFKRLEKGIYEIYFDKPLEPGEYGFMYAGATAVSGGASPRVYDFGIKGDSNQ